MVVCKFFQQGRCRYGESCHNEHPGARTSYEQPQTNRFAPLSNQGGSGGFGSRTRATTTVEENPYYLVAEDIRYDLTYRRDDDKGERPLYPLGAYGPGKGAPKQLIEGDLEQSPEELRVQAYLALANGQLPQFEAAYRQMIDMMDNKVRNIIDHTEDARRFAADTSHPNRNESVIRPPSGTWPYRLGQTQTQTASSGGFGSSAQAVPAFGAASRPGFGGASQPAFGASSMPNSGSAFGGTSSATAGGFGAPSALGSKPSPFGATASAAPSTGFGAPSALGTKPSPFGSAQPAAATGFGAPSAVGARSSPFGAPQQAATGGFGAASQPAFGSSGFGTRPAASPFATTAAQTNSASPFAAAPRPTGGFGSQQPAAQPNSSPFGGSQQQQAQTAGSAFGTPSVFGAARPSPFVSAAQQQQPAQPALSRPNPFAAPTGLAAQTNSSPFGAGQQQQASAAPPAFGASSMVGAATHHNRTPSMWKDKGRVVVDEKNDKPGYIVQDASKPNGQGIERIWFLEGPPEIKVELKASTEAKDPAIYEDPLIGPKLKEIYEWTAQHGTFVKDGQIIMPEIPPKREWCTFDF